MVSLELISEVLQGQDFPASRQQVLTHATTHGAPERVLKLLYGLPERSFSSMDDLWQEVMKL